MKKIIIIMAAMFIMGGSAMAQWNIGVRINNSLGLGGPEFSLQKLLSETSRVEADLGFAWGRYDHYTTATGAYHWTFPIMYGLQWFVGPGAQVGIYSHNGNDSYSYFRLAAVGQIGIEYKSYIPLQFALDIRPGINLLGFSSGDSWLYNCALSIRYCF